jgi:hypothetical protein
VVFFAKDTFKGKLTARPSLVTYHWSLITYHLSLITYHLSLITYHLSLLHPPAAFSQRSSSRGGASIRLAYFLAMSVEQPAIAA